MTSSYIVLVDQDAQEMADKRRHEHLKDQDQRIREVFRKRLGAMEYRTPSLRRQFYAAHMPVFVSVPTPSGLETVTLDEWIEAADDEDKRFDLLYKWLPILPALMDATPPQGQPQYGEVDPATGQPVVIDPGTPNWELRRVLWEGARQRLLTEGITARIEDLGFLLQPFWRERFFYYPKRIIKEIRDLRRLTNQSGGGDAPDSGY